MAQVKQNTAYNRVVLMVGSSDHITGLAGLTLTITASKAGGAFATITPTVTDLGSGFYSLALTAAMLSALGDFALHITGTNADPTDIIDQVIAQDLMSANVTANVVQVEGTAFTTHTAGQFPVDLRSWVGSAPVTPNSPGVPVVDDRNNTLRINAAQAGASNSITLDTGAPATDGYFTDCIVVLTGGTGAGQARNIQSYVGSTKVATVNPAWATAPAANTTFTILPAGQVDVGALAGVAQTSGVNIATQLDTNVGSRLASTGYTAPDNTTIGAINGKLPSALVGGRIDASVGAYQAGMAPPTSVSTDTTTRTGACQGAAASTLTLDSGASATDNYYAGQMVVMKSGAAQHQTRRIISYVGSTKVATLVRPWDVTPSAADNFALITLDRVDVSHLAGTSQTARDLGLQLDATVSSRLATTGYTAPDNTSIAGIKTKTDYLPSATAGAASGLQICGTNAPASYSGSGITASITGSLSGSVGSVTGNVGGSVASVTGAVGSVTAMTTANVTQIGGNDPVTTIQGAVFNFVVENSTSFVQLVRGMVATLLGKASGMGTTTVTFRDQADTKNRVSATVDANGNRTAVTTDYTP